MKYSTVTAPSSHDTLRLELITAGIQLHDALAEPSRFHSAREHVVNFCRIRLLPHLERDERWLVQAEECVPGGGLLADAIRVENRAITSAVLEIASATAPWEAVAATRVLHAFLATHTQNEQRLREVVAQANSAPDKAS